MPSEDTEGHGISGLMSNPFDLENEAALGVSLNAFRNSLLSPETSVRYLSQHEDGDCADILLDSKSLRFQMTQKSTDALSEIYFVHRRFIIAGSPLPTDANMLCLSPDDFDFIRSEFSLSPSFLSSLANFHHPSPRSFPCRLKLPHLSADFWMFLPTRVQVQPDLAKAKAHRGKATNQMNPRNYLHLPHCKSNIRGSKIAVYFTFKQSMKRSTALVIDFQDGRWKKVIEEPSKRLKSALQCAPNGSHGRDPIYLQATLLTSTLRWWNNSINSVNDQLIAYEEALLLQDLSDENSSRSNSELNRALHCVAAHLHRYSSELESLGGIIEDVACYNTELNDQFVEAGIRAADSLGTFLRSLGEIEAQRREIAGFRDELQQKIDNVLALLMDNTQTMNDRLLVKNSKAMQDILHATQEKAEESRNVAAQTQQLTEEMRNLLQATNAGTGVAQQLAKRSYHLSEEMRKDSAAMKTIALVTAFFLPGTSFAAILAMPFFAGNEWLGSADRAWVWLALTVPTTAFCIWFYYFWSRRDIKKARDYEMQHVGA